MEYVYLALISSTKNTIQLQFKKYPVAIFIPRVLVGRWSKITSGESNS